MIDPPPPLRVDNSRRAEILVAVGAPESGKSTAVNFKLDAEPDARLIAYDPGDDYIRHGDVFTSVDAVRRRLIEAGQGPFRIVFRPPDDLDRARLLFDVLCRLAYRVGNVLVAADELEDVVLPHWAPPGWSMLLRKGRKRGVRIVAASQRPAGLEKRVWSFATVVRSGRLGDFEDARTVARALMVDPLEVLSLRPLAWIQRDLTRGVILRGRIEWHVGRALDVLESQKNLLPPPTALPPA